jgi:mediator of RNA polymerase II transcription subunit 17, fungi type
MRDNRANCAATSIFRDRGLASLRRADDGSLILDKGLVPSKTRRIRVRVKMNDKVTGTSNPAKSASSDDQSIEGRILQAVLSRGGRR